MTTVFTNQSIHPAGRPASVVTLLCSLVCSLTATNGAAVADDRAAQLRAQRQQQIEGLSEIERSRLQRNFSEFRNLSEADREKLRQLDRDLKENDLNGGGSLRKVMEEYCNWLGTISISHREELRKTIDPKEREKLVREIRKEQESAVRPESPYGFWRIRGPVLSRKELDSVMKALEEALKKQVLDVHEQEELEKRKGLARYAFLLELVVRHEAPALRELREAFEQRRQGFQFQPRTPLPVIEELTAAVTDDKQRKELLEIAPPDRLRHLVRMMWNGIRAEYDRLKPTDKQLEEYFVKLKAMQQDELMRLPTEEMQRRLTSMYRKEHPEVYPPLPVEIFGLFPPQRASSSREGFDSDPRRKLFGPPGEPGDRRGPGGFRDKGAPPRKEAEKRPST